VHTRCTGFSVTSRDAPPRSGCVGTSRPQRSRRDAVLSARRSTLGAAVNDSPATSDSGIGDYAVGRSGSEVQHFAGTRAVDRWHRLSEVCA
jgi:hypothetical protein